ncbi:uncharacterized protein LOC126629798 [Malus sylvestris]|uniref:uncharacterized protein n=1 Tax=Malus domestica TaxID=3750 RepID=UPI0010AAAD36|nr:uncharacterized protein LOC103455306 [Malus domestica]XP_050155902.1 uncharacterized protein LOC126629798 [Malus sylvestris]
MYVLNIEELKKDILDEAHISAYAMHPEGIVKYHGVPVSIISDRDPRFTSKFWVAFQEALSSRLLYSTTYHPQTDGQFERTIQTLEDILRSSVLQFGDACHKRLDWMEFAYNNTYHSSIRMSHFKALYGKSCRAPFCWSKVCERVLVGPEIIDETTQNIQVFLKLSLWKGDVRFGKKDPSHVIPHQPLEINPDLTYDEEPMTILDWKDKVLRNKTVCMVKVLWRNHLVEEAT